MSSDREVRTVSAGRVQLASPPIPGDSRNQAEGRLVGYAAVYSTPTVIAGMFREVIKPGAFTKAVGRDDVPALFNHDPNFVMGRTKAGTLTLTDDKFGLRYDVS